mmetsp:Transcript_20488/g.27687  ORF Transcript_20488/g.27687 Transcript_20488/m.27687 type:complete len:98 (-) Transcript_20488:196-489(-)
MAATVRTIVIRQVLFLDKFESSLEFLHSSLIQILCNLGYDHLSLVAVHSDSKGQLEQSEKVTFRALAGLLQLRPEAILDTFPITLAIEPRVESFHAT